MLVQVVIPNQIFLLTRWAGNAWDRFKNKTNLIKKSAKRMGLWNCRCGCENHLIKVRKIQYEPPKEEDPKMEPLTKKQANNLYVLDKERRKEERLLKRAKRRQKQREKQSNRRNRS